MFNDENNRQYLLIHGLSVHVDPPEPTWTYRERLLWWSWPLRHSWGRQSRSGDAVRMLTPPTSSGPCLSSGSALVYADLNRLVLTYARELPEAGTVLNVDYVLRPTSSALSWSPVRSWWRRFKRLRIGGKQVPRAIYRDVHRQMPEAAANLVRWEVRQASPGWQRLNIPVSRYLSCQWQLYLDTKKFASSRNLSSVGGRQRSSICS